MIEESLNFMAHLKRHHDLPGGEHVCYCGLGSDPARQQHLPRSRLSAAKRAGPDCGGGILVTGGAGAELDVHSAREGEPGEVLSLAAAAQGHAQANGLAVSTCGTAGWRVNS